MAQGRDAAYATASKVMVDNLALRDGQEGIRAFIEKRKPVWSHKAEKAHDWWVGGEAFITGDHCSDLMIIPTGTHGFRSLVWNNWHQSQASVWATLLVKCGRVIYKMTTIQVELLRSSSLRISCFVLRLKTSSWTVMCLKSYSVEMRWKYTVTTQRTQDV